MSEIHAGGIVITYTDERLFAHVREAISDLIVQDRASFFITGESLAGRAAVLCGPNLPIQFLGAGVDGVADNDTWVNAIAVATRLNGKLSVVAEDQADELLRLAREGDSDD